MLTHQSRCHSHGAQCYRPRNQVIAFGTSFKPGRKKLFCCFLGSCAHVVVGGGSGVGRPFLFDCFGLSVHTPFSRHKLLWFS